jgi:hypothetical protein
MRTLKILTILPLWLTVLASTAVAQAITPEWVLGQINGVYAREDNVYHALRYDLKRQRTDRAAQSTETGRFIKANGNVYSEVGPIKSLVTGDYIISIDEDDKVLLLSANHQGETSHHLADLLDAMPEEVSMEVVAKAGATGILKMQAAYGEISEAELHYRRADYLLQKVVLQYRRRVNLATDEAEDYAQPTLEIVYQTNHLRPGTHPETQLGKYVKNTAGRWSLAPAYRHFTFINNLETHQR